MDTLERLNDVFRSLFDDESIELTDDTTAQEVEGWDSVAHISLIFAVEEEFGIKLSAGDLKKLETVGDLRNAVERRAAGN